MRKFYSSVCCLLILSTLLYAQNPIYFTSEPAPSPYGSKIVFSYEDDLWVVPASGGLAMRITAMDGRESDPVYSPDGKWIAFTGRQEGNPNIYLIPSAGGEIIQLTFNDASDNVESWSWDSKYIYFNSNRYNNIAAYKVAVSGGTPKRLFKGYKNRQHNIAESPLDGSIYFNETWESSRMVNRKRYKGAYNPDIKSYNIATGEYKQHTTFEGKDMWVTISSDGVIYFVSDRDNGEYNLYKLDNGNVVALTSFETSIKKPRVSADGNLIVFEKDYQLFSYNVIESISNPVEIKLYENKVLGIDQDFDVSGKITNFNVSTDGKKIVFVSRGRMFISDIEGKYVKEIPTNSGERVVEVLWLDDNETILYNRTVNGWLNLFTIKAGKPSPEKMITEDKQNNQEINLNSDRSKAVYFSGRNEMRILDIESLKSETVVRDEFWALYPTAAYFSPDDRYIAYAVYRNFEHDILVYDTENGESHHITKTGVTETDPFWSPDGKYIYFESDRINPGYPRGTKDSEIFRIALKRFDKEYKLDRYEKLFAEEEKKDSTKPIVEINFEGLNDRWEGIATQPMNQGVPYVIQKEDETTVLFRSNHDSESIALWKTVLKPFDKAETKKIEGSNSVGQICEAKGKYYVLSNSSIHELDLSGNKLKKIDVEFKFTKNLKDEFNQMFYEAWANLGENYYDDNYHGVDWSKLKQHYSKYLVHVKTRDNLRTVLNDMLGELNSSHLGFYSNGDEEKTFYTNGTITTGVMFDNENPYVVQRIVKRSPMDKEDKDIKRGDRLVAVNGTSIDPSVNREKYFTGAFRENEVVLTFERSGENVEVKVHPETRSALESHLYDEWVDKRQKKVDEKSDKRIAYVHMKNMGGNELNNFIIEMTNEAHYRDGLILDIRYNRGGNVHDDVLQFLSQKPYLKWKYRGGEFTPQPNFTPASKPIVLLINEQSLSDAEMTAQGFKALGLGTIVGTETYRWIIFTSGKSLVDGSYYRLPSWGCYTLEGKDIEMNGVAPDAYVKNNMVNRLKDEDPQLDKAIELIMQELAE